jgi:hypothetical protein
MIAQSLSLTIERLRMTQTLRTETIPYYTATLTRLADAGATPLETYRAAEELAKAEFPRETGINAVQRLHGLSHGQALAVADEATPYTEAFASDAERIAFERGQEAALGLEEE